MDPESLDIIPHTNDTELFQPLLRFMKSDEFGSCGARRLA
jgi:hypothetical protein